MTFDPETLGATIGETIMRRGWSEADTPDGKQRADRGREPARWLGEFAEALDGIAWDIGDIVSFRPDDERRLATWLDSGELIKPWSIDDLRRTRIRALHGKKGAERRKIQRRWDKLMNRRMTGQEYLRASCVQLLFNWPRMIHRASALLDEVSARMDDVFASPIIAGAADLIREALTCLVTISREGLSLMKEWQETCRIREFSDEDAIEELFLDAAVFEERLGKDKMERSLETLADRIRAHGLTWSKAERKLNEPERVHETPRGGGDKTDTGGLDSQSIVLKDFDQTVFDEIGGTNTRVGIEYLVSRLPGLREKTEHPDPKTVRSAVNRLCRFGLVEDEGGRNGIAITPKGKVFASAAENNP